MDIIAGASLARRTVNLPLLVVKTRLWLGAPLRLQAPERCKKMLDLNPGTGSSNPFPSSGESSNFRFLASIIHLKLAPPARDR